jgi:hypothetical protein
MRIKNMRVSDVLYDFIAVGSLIIVTIIAVIIAIFYAVINYLH